MSITAYPTSANGDIIIIDPEDEHSPYMAFWREDWPGTDGSEMGYSYGSRERAAIDLMERFPR
jgi:hypothetical protein